MLYPPVRVCNRTYCSNQRLLRDRHERNRVALFTLDKGVQDAFSVHLYCYGMYTVPMSGCFHINYSIGVKPAKLRTIMTTPCTRACVHITLACLSAFKLPSTSLSNLAFWPSLQACPFFLGRLPQMQRTSTTTPSLGLTLRNVPLHGISYGRSMCGMDMSFVPSSVMPLTGHTS